MKLSDFVKQSTVPAKLIRAVVRQVGGWDNFTEIEQITNCLRALGVLSWIVVL